MFVELLQRDVFSDDFYGELDQATLDDVLYASL